MNDFTSFHDTVFRGSRSQCGASRGWRRSFRKRRANSDSDIPPILVENYVSHGVSDDSVIDIMSDSLSEYSMSLHKATMDPSQMFIPHKKSFSWRNPSRVCTPTPEQSAPSVDMGGLETEGSSSLFPTQFYYLHTNISDQINVATVDANNPTVEEVIDDNFCTTAEVDITPRHIPAKYLRKPLPAEVLNKNLSSKQQQLSDDDEVTSYVNQQWITHKADKQELREKGVEWKCGVWSVEEEEILRTNIDNYCEKNNIVDPTLMIFTSSKDARRRFYRTIAHSLNRPLFAVYQKVKRMYDTRNYLGKYTHEDEQKLMELVTTFNYNWVTIGEQLGRSANSVRDKYRLLSNAKSKGKWLEWEVKELSKAVHDQTNTKHGESVSTGINWVKIAQTMVTRTEKQCYNKWLFELNWKEAGGKRWLKTDEIELINRISNTGASEEGQLNWNQLSNNWACVRSPQWLQKKWRNIKNNVPDSHKSPFSQLLEYLKTTYIDSIWDTCKKSLLNKNEKSSKKNKVASQRQHQQHVEGQQDKLPTSISMQQQPQQQQQQQQRQQQKIVQKRKKLSEDTEPIIKSKQHNNNKEQQPPQHHQLQQLHNNQHHPQQQEQKQQQLQQVQLQQQLPQQQHQQRIESKKSWSVVEQPYERALLSLPFDVQISAPLISPRFPAPFQSSTYQPVTVKLLVNVAANGNEDVQQSPPRLCLLRTNERYTSAGDLIISDRQRNTFVQQLNASVTTPASGDDIIDTNIHAGMESLQQAIEIRRGSPTIETSMSPLLPTIDKDEMINSICSGSISSLLR